MLSMSAADEAELERWRSVSGRCQLAEGKQRPIITLPEVIARLPRAMAIIMRDKLRAGGWLGSFKLDAEEIGDIQALDKIDRQDIMLRLLDVASALAQTTEPGANIGAVVDGVSGGLYTGANIEWRGTGIKFSVHGVQAAVLNAWNYGEQKLRSLMVETQPCACCRQFLRETWDWANIKIIVAEDGATSVAKQSLHEIGLNLKGIRTAGLISKLLHDTRSRQASGKRDLQKLAAEAAAASYAPYSRNFAGVALRTKRGTIHQGRYAEIRESMAGVLAIEAALTDVVLCGGQIADIEEIVLVESKGVVTQFLASQTLASRMGNIPFRFTMSTPTKS